MHKAIKCSQSSSLFRTKRAKLQKYSSYGSQCLFYSTTSSSNATFALKKQLKENLCLPPQMFKYWFFDEKCLVCKHKYTKSSIVLNKVDTKPLKAF